ncbi:type III-B CRISPR-associated protein Cas10/Cmr2 [Thermococcus indicus]|uniref:Type III-B CRISPR-associated protein Cas10/Cmr2 n=1 Tax=Thermococcus indicus TaxID=2586643 RepID=A0A4Y5SNL5_9EURY|nr:type III-B CRISPR-associated protein Cas10/Cmr2 [Thermococcus indicus]QDA31651.1 type III-B CRISPR-associated protein Cas10/Cmr2 [Thermococcus indicus]
MNPWNSYARALREVAPSKLLGSLIGRNDLPEEWRHLSSYPALENPELDKFVLKHPISADGKPLENLSVFWFNASDEQRGRFLEAISRAEERIATEIENSSSVEKFAKLWNGLPAKLKEEYRKVLEEGRFKNADAIAEELVHFPAEPALPDHDWLSRLDVYALVRTGKVKLLRFKLSPVQGFIANARTERDLWAGSHMLSLLTYLAISEIWRSFGPNALVIPHLRGQPFFEHELDLKSLEEELHVANMPNKILAMVPESANIEALRHRIESRLRDFMETIFRSAWEFYDMDLEFKMESVYLDTIRGHFSVTVETVPLVKLNEVIEEPLRAYLEKLPDEFEGDVHHYPELFAVLDQKTDFSSLNHEKPEQPMGFRCTLCGEHLAIGGRANYKAVSKAWEELRKRLTIRKVYDIKDKERLCPVCLAKRFYPRFYSLWVDDFSWVSRDFGAIAKKTKQSGNLRLKRFRSVSEVAMRRPTEKAWRLFERGELEVNGRPVTWYDVFLYIALDFVQEWRGTFSKPTFSGTIAGEFESTLKNLEKEFEPLFRNLSPNSEALYVENIRDTEALAKVYGVGIQELPENVSLDSIAAIISRISELIGEPPKYYAVLKMDGDNMGKVLSGSKAVKDVGEYFVSESKVGALRPVTPVIHTAITRSLSRFAVGLVPNVAETHDAELLYAGGDDVLALVPIDRAFSLSYDVRGEFSENWIGHEPLQGDTRSMSGGLLISYYKEPLYAIIPDVNKLEHLAKESGRNALAIGYRKHSGAFYKVVVNWETFENARYVYLLDALRNGKLSRKLAYELNTETWPNEPWAVLNLLKYEFSRHSNYGRDEREEFTKILASFLWLVKNVRVVLTREELGATTEKSPEEVNKEIAKVVASDPEREFISPFNSVVSVARALVENRMPEAIAEKQWFDVLSEKVGSRVAGMVVKKQVAGAAVLLKVLLETGVRK